MYNIFHKLRIFQRIQKIAIVLGLSFVLLGSVFGAMVAVTVFIQPIPVEAVTLKDFQIINIPIRQYEPFTIPPNSKKHLDPAGNTPTDPDIIDVMIAVEKFLVILAPIIATLVIIWGGYQYFLSGTTDGQKDGLKAVQAAVIGLALVLGAEFFITILIPLVFPSSGGVYSFSATGLVTFIEKNFVTTLINLSSIIAVLVIVWGGYKYFISTLPNAKDEGKDTIIKGVLCLIVILLAYPIVGLIQSIFPALNNTTTASVVIGNAQKTIITFIQDVLIKFLIPLSSIVTVFFIILGGYYFLTAADNADSIAKGRKTLINALIGLVVVLAATTIVSLVIYFTKNL